ncbi:MAG: hypothetical protein ACHRHE_12800 [Tepidisphaerales bacterium]
MRPAIGQFLPAVLCLSGRRRRLRALAMLVGLTLLVRLIWGWHVGRQLTAQLEQMRQRGEPVEWSDIAYAPLADAQNAAIVQANAAAALSPTVESPGNSNLVYDNCPPYPPAWMKMAAASEKANAAAFALLRQSRPLKEAQHRRTLSLWAMVMLNNLNGSKTLALAASDGAMYSHLQGDDAEAVERVHDLLHLSSSLRQDQPMVTQIIGIGINGVGCNCAQVIAPGLRFDPGATSRPATRQQVRQVIGLLTDEKTARERLRRSLMAEGVFTLDWYRHESAGQWVIQPLADIDALQEIRNQQLLVQAAGCTNWPAAQAILKAARWKDEPMSPFKWGTASLPIVPRYSRWFTPDGYDRSRSIQMHFHNEGEQRATAVSLACQLFRADHGRWPARLEELVADSCLPALPLDPFHDDVRPMGYVVLKAKQPGGGDRPLVYFDAGPADDSAISDKPMYGQQVGAGPTGVAIRQYRDISRFVPPPLPKTVDHDRQKPDAPGDKPDDDQRDK